MDADSIDAKKHPLIKEFVNLVEETVGDGVLDINHIQEPPFMKFWQHFIIYRYEKDINDFRVQFYGTHTVSMYGADWTGKLLSEMGFAEAYDDIYKMNMNVLNGDRRIYAQGTLFWQNREHRKWYQVKMPLQRKGAINEVLICIDIP